MEKSFVIKINKKWCYCKLFGEIEHTKESGEENIKEEGKEGRWENKKKICYK
jgi:hypothetical protein